MRTRLLALLLALSLTVDPALAKAVSLDVQHNPSQPQFEINRPYFIDLRKRIESNWINRDPAVGVSVQIRIILGTDGTLVDFYPLGPTSNLTQEQNAALCQACHAVIDSKPFPPLPAGQGIVAIHASFKSRRLPGARVDPNKVAKALEIAAIAALVGFSIYALCKWGGSSGSVGGGSYGGGHRCIGSSACTACSNCSQCYHCNNGGAPCNVWYGYHY